MIINEYCNHWFYFLFYDFIFIVYFAFQFFFTDSSDVWTPSSQPQELNTSSSTTTPDKKSSSHIWHTAPVPDWSKEQVHIYFSETLLN